MVNELNQIGWYKDFITYLVREFKDNYNCKVNVVDNNVHDDNFCDFEIQCVSDTYIKVIIPFSESINQGFLTFRFDETVNKKKGLSYNFRGDDTFFFNGKRLRMRRRAGQLAFDITDNY